MDTLQTETTPEEHQYIITDVRFRPNSTQLATASYDKSVRMWDAANVMILSSSLLFDFIFIIIIFFQLVVQYVPISLQGLASALPVSLEYMPS